MAFVPGTSELLLCVTDERDEAVTLSPLQSSRLVRQNISSNLGGRGGSSPKTLVEFPLSHVSDPVVSPDGKRLALVCNRDYPRTAAIGGHVYVGNADGTNLQQRSEDVQKR